MPRHRQCAFAMGGRLPVYLLIRPDARHVIVAQENDGCAAQAATSITARAKNSAFAVVLRSVSAAQSAAVRIRPRPASVVTAVRGSLSRPKPKQRSIHTTSLSTGGRPKVS